jgi:hypothetical protein
MILNFVPQPKKLVVQDVVKPNLIIHEKTLNEKLTYPIQGMKGQYLDTKKLP